MKPDEAWQFSMLLGFELTKNDFKTATVEKVDGGTKITCKLDMSEWGDSETKISPITYRYIIADDNMLKLFSYSTTIISTNDVDYTKIKISRNMNVKSVNSITKIDFPSDLESYKLI